MIKVFISGSMKIRKLDPKVIERLENIVHSEHAVIVGDSDGVDSSVQAFLRSQQVASVVVYCSGEKPRNNLGNWSVKSITTTHKPGTREFFTAKDTIMADDCDCGFLVWDARSSGTLNNVVELVARRKAALVYVNKAKHFLKVKDAKDFDALLGHMTEAALMKADRKIGVLKKIEALKFSQPDFLNLGQADPANRRSA